MNTVRIDLKLPEALAQELHAANQEFLIRILERGLREIKIEQALQQYGRGGVSFSAAAHQPGISQDELARHAYARGMEPPFSATTLAEELS